MLQAFIATFESKEDIVTEFDPALWRVLPDHTTVYIKEDVNFIFRDGTEIQTQQSQSVQRHSLNLFSIMQMCFFDASEECNLFNN